MHCKANETVTLPTANAPAGYTFLGWVTEEYNNVAEQPAVLTGSYAATADITLKAQSPSPRSVPPSSTDWVRQKQQLLSYFAVPAGCAYMMLRRCSRDRFYTACTRSARGVMKMCCSVLRKPL